MNPSLMRIVIVAVMPALSSFSCHANDDEADIVTGCLIANAEFGIDIAHLCIRENQAARAAVLRDPDDVKEFVVRCSRHKDMGWEFVRKCIDDDIAAASVLEAYAKDHGPLVDRRWGEMRRQGAVGAKLCVEKAIATGQSQGEN